MYLQDGYKTQLHFVQVFCIYVYCVSHLAAGKWYLLLVGGKLGLLAKFEAVCHVSEVSACAVLA